MLYKVVRKYLSEKGMGSWLLTQCWFLYISICFSRHTSMYFYIFLKRAAVASYMSSPCSPQQLPDRGSVQNTLSYCVQCFVVCSSNTQTSYIDSIYTSYDFSCVKSVQMGLFGSFLKFEVEEEINSIEASCSLHCSSSQSAEATL